MPVFQVVQGPEFPDGGSHTRWTWDDTGRWYPQILAAGRRLDRAHDLRLCRVVLRGSPLAAHTPYAGAPDNGWDALVPAVIGAEARKRPGALLAPGSDAPGHGASARQHQLPDELLFSLDADPATPQPAACDPQDELDAQLAAVGQSRDPGRLRLLLAAESAGALIAAEMHYTGLPWRADIHDQILTERLGPRPPAGYRPAVMEELVTQIRDALDAPTLNPDSLPNLLKAMQYAGLQITTTSRWEIEHLDHPVIAPLTRYKKLNRLLVANGWTWLDEWVHDGRFRTHYIVGGVVTGRWASSGGGALQLPKVVRPAVVADPGWVLVVADAAQLEPRVLAGMAHDERMAAAGRGRDLYQGMVDDGVVESRDDAKIGMLGAMYGGTTGRSAVVLPKLAGAFPRAIAMVEAAARAGERGQKVSTLLGRGSPRPGASWQQTQDTALAAGASSDAQSRARHQTRAWGRFTRNFIVQGTAAEWAECWLALLRQKLWALPVADVESWVCEPFAGRAHLVFFQHDEVIVHTPAVLAESVMDAVRDAARVAGELLFGSFPVDFPLSVACVDSYAQAK